MGDNIEQLISQQHGVVRRSELLAAGMSRRALQDAIGAGTFRWSGRSVLVHHSAPPGLRTDTLVAAKRNPDAVLTGVSATLLRPHPVWTGRVLRDAVPTIIAPRHRSGPWRTVQHPGAHYDTCNGFTVADTHTTLVDLLRLLPWRDAAAVAGAANLAGLTSHDLLVASAKALHNHPGSPQLAALVRGMLRGAESGPEIDLHRELFRHGVRGWVANPTVHITGELFRPDVAFLPQRIAVEYDGVEEHSTTAAFHHDRARDFTFEFRGGWLVARMTSRTLYDQANLARFMQDLGSTVRARRRQGS